VKIKQYVLLSVKISSKLYTPSEFKRGHITDQNVSTLRGMWWNGMWEFCLLFYLRVVFRSIFPARCQLFCPHDKTSWSRQKSYISSNAKRSRTRQIIASSFTMDTEWKTTSYCCFCLIEICFRSNEVTFLQLPIWVLVSVNNRIKMAVKKTMFFLFVIVSPVAVMAMQPVNSGGKY